MTDTREREDGLMEFDSRESRRQSFYRRVSVHHFHVMKDTISCCCCVPLGMAYHMIAAADLSIAIIIAV